MLNLYFKNKSPFCYEYFSNLLDLVIKNERSFLQAIIFEGSDTKFQYLFSMELARLLNPDNKAVMNSKWIKNFSHPAVNNVSQIHFKPDNDVSKTVISVKQAQMIENSLRTTSDYHRFFIFFSSKEYDYDVFELNDFQKLGYTTDINFSIEPLDFSTFHPAALNVLLKSIEEPPKNTTFIFLTKSKENILSTIVSRCAVFKLNSDIKKTKNHSIYELFSFYSEINYENAFDLVQKIIDYTDENQVETENLLDDFILILKDLMLKNTQYSVKIMNDIKIINQTAKMIKAKVNEKISLEAMFLRLIRGY